MRAVERQRGGENVPVSVCAHVKARDQHRFHQSLSTLLLLCCLCFETGLLTEAEHAISASPGDPPVSTSEQPLQERMVAPGVYVGLRAPNSSPHPCLAGSLPSEPSPQPKSFDLPC